MLMQTNSYIVPRDKHAEHARLLRRFRQVLHRLGCDQFEAYEQTPPQWGTGEVSGRFVQIIKFRDRRHQQAVQAAEREDATAQQLIAEFCELINFPYQQQQGLFASGFYNSILPVGPAARAAAADPDDAPAGESPQVEPEPAGDALVPEAAHQTDPQPDPGTDVPAEFSDRA